MRTVMAAHVERGDLPGLVTLISRGDFWPAARGLLPDAAGQDSRFSRPPGFPSAAGGLVSTAVMLNL